MKRFALFMLLLILAACAEVPQGDYALVPLEGQALTPGIYEHTEGGQAWRLFVGITPTPSRVPPTNTPRATATPTLTPSPTPTLPPTQDDPFLTPTPENKCYGEVISDLPLRLRSTPEITSGNIITTIAPGTSVALLARSPDKAWYAINHYVDKKLYSGWVSAEFIEADANAWCSNLPFQQPGTSRLLPAYAIHVVPSANGDEMLAAFSELRSAGIPFGVKSVAEPDLANKTYQAGGLSVHRNWAEGCDCPRSVGTNPIEEAHRHYNACVSPPQGLQADFIEITNECAYDFALSNWWISYAIEMGTILEGRGYGIIFPSMAPGHWDLADVEAARPFLDWCKAHRCMLGEHPYWIEDDNDWLGLRWRRLLAWLEAYGYADIPIALTEVGIKEGNEPPNVAIFTAYYLKTVPYGDRIRMVAFWTAGHVNAWNRANLNTYMIAMARAVILALR